MLKKKRFLALSLSLLMVCSLAACSKKAKETTADATPTTAPTTAPTKEATPTPEPFVGIDFEDGQSGFVQVNPSPGDADATVLSVVDFNGSKQLFVDCQSFKVPYVGIDVSSLVGDKITEVRSIEMDITSVSADNVFRSISGKVVACSGVNLTETKDDWSVYLDTKNPNKAKGTLDNEAEYFVAGAKNYFYITKTTDTGKDVVESPSDFYIDNIVLRDANGNAIAVDTSVGFDKPAGFGEEDWSNLTKVKDEVEIEGFKVSGAGWSQAGVTTIANAGTFDPTLIQPGSIITIKYNSTGNVWLVAVPVEGAPYGWTRIEQGTAAKNDSGNTVQITYDQIVKALGTEDFASSLYALQAEGEADWEVSSVTIGVESKQLPLTMNDVEIADFAVSATGWTQAGVDTVAAGGTFDPALLQPGSVVTINYKSDGNVWLVAVPSDGAPFGWTRIEQGTAAKNDDNTKCQITYEQIVAALGTEDLSGLASLQCEGEMDWEVYSVTIGTYAPKLVAVKDEVEIADFAVASTAWSQAGVDTTLNNGTFDATTLKPGCVVTIKYKSEGSVWLVAVPGDGAPYGWTRIEQGTAAKNAENNTCQITYDQIVKALGTEDFAASLAILQCESDFDWEVYSVSIGYPAE